MINKTNKRQIFVVAPGDPWSIWTVSGIVIELCKELKKRGLLYGAISSNQLTTFNLKGPGPFYKDEQELIKKIEKNSLKIKKWNSEYSGLIRDILKELPSGTVVLYIFHNPEIDPNLPIKRFLLKDIALADAVKLNVYGHEKLSESEIEEKYKAQKKCLNQAEGLITYSTYAFKSIAKDYDYPIEKVTAIGGCSNISINNVNNNIERYKKAQILFCGRDWERKGGPILLKAFRKVKQVVPNSTLTIVGPSELIEGEGINFLGPIDKGKKEGMEKMIELFSESSLFCTPTLCDTWGLVFIEAANAGMPIVSFNNWSLPDIVKNGKTGLLVKEGSVEELAKAIIKLLKNPAEMQKMGIAARKRVKDVLAINHVVDRLLSRVLPEALEGRKPVPLQ